MSGAEQVLTVLSVHSSTEVTFAVSEPAGIWSLNLGHVAYQVCNFGQITYRGFCSTSIKSRHSQDLIRKVVGKKTWVAICKGSLKITTASWKFVLFVNYYEESINGRYTGTHFILCSSHLLSCYYLWHEFYYIFSITSR